jgi:alpha-tubulin suppressor-like RCC1 family protein
MDGPSGIASYYRAVTRLFVLNVALIAGCGSGVQGTSDPDGGSDSGSGSGAGSTAVAIAHGGAFTCALIAGGNVKCWGDNDSGQLGNTAGFGNSSPTPVPVRGVMGAKAIAAGFQYACALLADSTVICWGQSDFGQLGDGAPTTSPPPGSSVTGLTGVTAISAAFRHACALLSDGTVACWGIDDQGQLGDGAISMFATTPVPVAGLTGATAIAAGGNHTCALVSGGAVECWGDNSYGQLGNGTTTASPSPTPVTGLTGATAITTGAFASCALLSSGAVECWGANGSGSLDTSTTPALVAKLASATAIAAGDSYTCALLSGGTVQCWGANSSGELGNGTTISSLTTPVMVSGLMGATAIAAESGHTCALVSGGGIKCWGDDLDFDLGDGKGFPTTTPVTVTGL